MPTTTAKQFPAKVMIRRTTHSPKRQKVKATSKKVADTVYLNPTTDSVNFPMSSGYQKATDGDTSSTTGAFYLSGHPAIMTEKTVNNTSSLVPDAESASAVTPLIQAIPSRNIDTTAQNTASPTSATVKMKPILDESLCQCDQHKTQITPGYVTRPLIMSTSPRTFDVDNNYDTTPEVTSKNNQNQIPFIDSLESREQSSDMEIVQVDFNPSTKIETNQKKIEIMKQNANAIKHIRYFYDPDEAFPLHESLRANIKSPSRLSIRKSEHKILAQKRRQPK